MKKLIVSLLLICLMCCSACTEENLDSRAEQGLIEYEYFADNVVADEDTHILYIYRNDGESAVICPYYSKNGKLCRYEDGKIIEVENDD